MALSNAFPLLLLLACSSARGESDCVDKVKEIAVPKYVDDVPNTDVKVMYPNNMQGQCGKMLQNSDISLYPKISLEGDLCGDKNITIIMVDIDGGFPDDSNTAKEAFNVPGTPIAHDSTTDNVHNLWLVCNIRPDDFKKQDYSKANIIYGYLQPSKLKTDETTTHRVFTFLQCQEQYVNPLDYADQTIDRRRKFNMKDFTSNNDQKKTLSAQYYTVKPVGVPSTSGLMGMMG